MQDNKLPPLPGSDQQTLEHDRNARDFWKNNQITRIEDTDMPKCKHEFKSAPGGVECQKCHFGLTGQLEVQDGKLLYRGEQIEL